MHRHMLPLALVLAASAPAQNVLFEETFENGLPPTWTQILRSWGGDRWLPGVNFQTQARDVFHEYFCAHGFYYRDNLLVTPPIDLRGFADATFRCDQYQTFPTSRQLNRVEVSTNGITFQPVYTETGTWSGPGTITVDLTPFLGQRTVHIAFHYQGYVANEWRIDNVRVTTTQPVLAIDSLVAGTTATFAVRGAVPGNAVLVGISLHGAGPVPTPFGDVLLSAPIGLLPIHIADQAGRVAVPKPIPAGLTGLSVWSHAAALQPNGTVRWSNALFRSVQ